MNNWLHKQLNFIAEHDLVMGRASFRTVLSKTSGTGDGGKYCW
jgi:hypothetical protein